MNRVIQKERRDPASPLFIQVFVMAFFVTVACWTVRPVEAVTLQLTPATDTHNRFDITLSAGLFSVPDESDASGTVELDAQYSFVNSELVISDISFHGGQIAFDDIQFDLFFVEVTGTGVAGTPETPVPPSVVVGTEFDAGDHRLTIDQGIFISVDPGGEVIETVDVSETPFGGPGDGTGSIVTSEVARSPWNVTYDTTVTIPVAFEGRVATVNSIPIDVEFGGSIQATGSWTVPFSGDFNDDNMTDASDFTIWRDAMGATGEGLPADGNADSVVDPWDYEIWVADFGATQSTSLGTIQNVPEPGHLSLVLLLPTLVLWRLFRQT